tara:strand:- start:2183 stop:2806 length:624 start_codon:yes stop_codon:yes gene_type:complete
MLFGDIMLHMVDLCAGLGGASEAMVRSNKWSVLRIDNNPLLADVPFMVMADVKQMQGKVKSHAGIEKIDLVWASPPCVDFSGGYSSPKSIAAREIGLENYNPDLSLVKAIKNIIDTVQPKYWVVENVVGSIRYLSEILGEPRQIIGPYVLWGNFPFIDLDPGSIIPKKYKDTNGLDPLRANKRAKVDLLLSIRLAQAIETQKTLFEY